MIDWLSQRYKMVVVAVGDWGSCSSWSFHDSVELEKRGVVAPLLVTSTFLPLVEAQAKARRLPASSWCRTRSAG